MHRDRLLRDRYKFCVQNEANQKVFDLFKVNRRALVILNTCIISFTNLIERNVFFLHRTKFMMSRPRLHLPVQAMVCVAAFGFGLPLAIALFPQTSQVRSLIRKKVYAALLIRPSLINGWLNCLGSRFRRGRLGVRFPAGATFGVYV